MLAKDALLLLAASYVGIHEWGGDNHGPEVEEFLACMGLKAGLPWCAASQMFLIQKIEKATEAFSPIFRSAQAMTIWNMSPKRLRLDAPEPGCLMIWKRPTGGHVGLVEKVTPKKIITLEGNTTNPDSEDKTYEGFYRKQRTFTGSKDMQVVGWLKVFP